MGALFLNVFAVCDRFDTLQRVYMHRLHVFGGGHRWTSVNLTLWGGEPALKSKAKINWCCLVTQGQVDFDGSPQFNLFLEGFLIKKLLVSYIITRLSVPPQESFLYLDRMTVVSGRSVDLGGRGMRN